MSSDEKTPAQIELEDSLRSIRTVGESADGRAAETAEASGEQHDDKDAPTA